MELITETLDVLYEKCFNIDNSVSAIQILSRFGIGFVCMY